MDTSLQWIWKILRPLEEADVLVRREIPFYSRRRHWMIAAPDFFEGLSTVGVALSLLLFGTLPGGVFGGLLVIVAVAGLIQMYRNKNPWLNVTTLAAAVIFGFLMLGPNGAGLFALFWSAQRFFGALITWRFYDRLYITDRRVIGSRGIFQSKIDTLPLSRATDISYTRTFLGEVLGYATLRIETAGQEQALGLIPFIIDPEIFYELLILQSVGTADVA